MKSPRRRYFWPPMTPVLSRASSYSLMVAERKSKSFASVARGRFSAWENGSRAGHWRFDGHKVPENDDDPRIIGETRQYLRDFDRLNEATANARELYDVMLELYPDRVNPGSLWGAANTAKKQA